MPKTPRPLPDDLARRPFRAIDAAAHGMSRGRLRRADVQSVARGVYVGHGGEHDDPSLLRAIETVLGPAQYFSHVTALLLWECPVPLRHRRAGLVHVTTVGPGPVMRRPGVVGHRVDAAAALVSTEVEPRVSTPAAAWYECRTLFTRAELVALGDHLVGNGGLCTPEQLAAMPRRGDRAVRVAREAASLVRLGVESWMESVARLIVVDAGFPEPECNVDVRDERGAFLGRADMAWPELRIALEYDGDHHRDQGTFRRDQRRGNGFTVSGWLSLHLTASDVHDPAAFLLRLQQAFHARGAI